MTRENTPQGLEAAPRWRKWRARASTRTQHSTSEAVQQAVREARQLLARTPCCVCSERDEAVERWLKFFIADSHTDQGVMGRVRAAGGLCPAHTRALLADPSAPWLLPQVHQAALHGSAALLDPDGPAPLRCAACTAGDSATQRALATLTAVIDHNDVRSAVHPGTVCLPHLAELTAHVPPEEALLLAAATSASLEEHQPSLPVLAGADPDADARCAQYTRLDRLLPVEAERQLHGITARWESDLDMGSCPLCLAQERSVRRLLQWMATRVGRGAPNEEERRLCPRHLYDIDAIGGPGLPPVLEVATGQWQDRLTRFRRLLTQGKGAPQTAGAELTATVRCRACAEQELAEARQLGLLTAQLQDPVQAQKYAVTHGVCLRHAAAHRNRLPAGARSLLVARLAQLSWEVDEALRKQDWRTRHETRGAEATVDRRAPTLLDGQVWAGMPPPSTSAEDPTPHPREPHEETAPNARRDQWSST